MDISAQIESGIVFLSENWLSFLIYILAVNLFVLILSAVIIVYLPEDYLVNKGKKHPQWLRLLRDSIGAVLVIAGVLMLALPGPGMLTVVSGLALMDGEEKKAVLRKICRRKKIGEIIQRIRTVFKRNELIIYEENYRS